MLTYYLLAISEYCLSRSLICTQCLQMHDCPLQERLVSSANMEALVVCRQFGRSLIYKLNSKGPRFDPCGASGGLYSGGGGF